MESSSFCDASACTIGSSGISLLLSHTSDEVCVFAQLIVSVKCKNKYLHTGGTLLCKINSKFFFCGYIMTKTVLQTPSLLVCCLQCYKQWLLCHHCIFAGWPLSMKWKDHSDLTPNGSRKQATINMQEYVILHF